MTWDEDNIFIDTSSLKYIPLTCTTCTCNNNCKKVSKFYLKSAYIIHINRKHKLSGAFITDIVLQTMWCTKVLFFICPSCTEQTAFLVLWNINLVYNWIKTEIYASNSAYFSPLYIVKHPLTLYVGISYCRIVSPCHRSNIIRQTSLQWR